jgi:hypothetical protein
MDATAVAVQAAMVGGLKDRIEACLKAHTDHIVITNPSSAGMDSGEGTPRYKFNKERLTAIADPATASPIIMCKAFVRGKLSFDHGPYGWLKMEHAIKLGGMVNQAGMADCDLCAAAAVWAIRQCSDLNAVQIEAFGTGGHAFIVLNRASGSTENDPSSWGPDCLVVDVWSYNQGMATTRVMRVSEYCDMYSGGLRPGRLM